MACGHAGLVEGESVLGSEEEGVLLCLQDRDSFLLEQVSCPVLAQEGRTHLRRIEMREVVGPRQSCRH